MWNAEKKTPGQEIHHLLLIKMSFPETRCNDEDDEGCEGVRQIIKRGISLFVHRTMKSCARARACKDDSGEYVTKVREGAARFLAIPASLKSARGSLRGGNDVAYLSAGRFRAKRVSRVAGSSAREREREKSRRCNEIARSSTAVESNVRLIVREREEGNDNIRLQMAFRLARSFFFSDCARTIRSSLKRTT